MNDDAYVEENLSLKVLAKKGMTMLRLKLVCNQMKWESTDKQHQTTIHIIDLIVSLNPQGILEEHRAKPKILHAIVQNESWKGWKRKM